MVKKARKRGRPKGSKNKPLTFTYDNLDWKPQEATEIKTVTLASRLDECMTRLENAVAEAIAKLKEMI